MLLRFSLYGFLKNQQYYEPFLILAFREKGLSFFMIGLLIAFREILVNVMEVPSGAVADLYGRRRCMILSMTAYVASFGVFGYSRSVWQLFVAMALFAVGEAFRTGTHKAIILDWLGQQDRLDEKTRFYGTTRAWAKVGSAISVLIAAGLVLAAGRYSPIFYLTMVPYVLAIINLATYPSHLDGERKTSVSVRELVAYLWRTLRESIRNRDLRRLMGETIGFDGVYTAVKDYLQPVLKQAAVAMPVLVALEGERRAALLVGAVYFVLHMLSSAGSLQSYRLVRRLGGEERGARSLWRLNLLLFAFLCFGMGLGWHPAIIVGFVALAVVQNVWRPIQIGRIGDRVEPARTATVLSIESQLKSAFVAVTAPLLGFLVDRIASVSPDVATLKFLPVALVGVLAASLILIATRPLPQPSR